MSVSSDWKRKLRTSFSFLFKSGGKLAFKEDQVEC